MRGHTLEQSGQSITCISQSLSAWRLSLGGRPTRRPTLVADTTATATKASQYRRADSCPGRKGRSVATVRPMTSPFRTTFSALRAHPATPPLALADAVDGPADAVPPDEGELRGAASPLPAQTGGGRVPAAGAACASRGPWNTGSDPQAASTSRSAFTFSLNHRAFRFLRMDE